MKILEAREGFIIFESDESIHLSSFIQAESSAKNYIAQVVQIKSAGSISIASAKILFLFDGTLQTYDNTLPSKDSEIKEITFNILNNSIRFQTPVIAGKTQGAGINIVIDESAFNKKMLISADNKSDKNIIFRNLVKQFNNLGKNTIIIDTHGAADANKYTAGIDFKLPLDTASLSFMYEDCLNDATADSKSLIIEIFRDLSDYSKTVPFLPFEALKTIVDDMVDKSHVFKLLVLKNKLAKFDKLGYFAKNKSEIDKIDAILNSNCAVIDLSKLDKSFQNRYLAFLYEKLKEKQNTQVIIELSNTISKKNLKNIMTADIPAVFSARSQFQYLNDIKNFFDNFIITPSASNSEVFKIYNTFLKAMPANTYLITGEAVNYIPIVSTLQTIDETISTQIETEEQVIKEEIEDIEPEEEITEEAVQEEIIEEKEEISNEEILANIEEKSDAVISEAAKDLTPPPAEMFAEDDEEFEQEEAEEFEETADVQEELEDEPAAAAEEEEEEEIIEELELEDIESTAAAEEEISNEIEEPAENIIEADYEALEIVEEKEEPVLDNIPLEESFDSEIPLLEEIAEEPAAEKNYDEFITDFSSNENLTDINGPIILAMPEDFNFDLNTDTEKENNIEEEFELQEIEEIPGVIPIANDDSDFDEIVELEPDDIDENAIIIDMEDEEENIPLNDEEIIKEVDKVFTTRKDDDISDSDLDLIDELNSDDVELELDENSRDEILQELSNSDDSSSILDTPQEEIDLREADDDILETRSSSTPIVPVYDADIPQEDLVMSDPISQGDSVIHAKYGNGIVEKMIKYGNKTLFSINFDNIGRRLLDPTLTEIKKN